MTLDNRRRSRMERFARDGNIICTGNDMESILDLLV
jgi:hypothetical protein